MATSGTLSEGVAKAGLPTSKAPEKVQYIWGKQGRTVFSGLVQEEANSTLDCYAYTYICACAHQFFETNQPTKGRALHSYIAAPIWTFPSSLAMRLLWLPGKHLVNLPYR